MVKPGGSSKSKHSSHCMILISVFSSGVGNADSVVLLVVYVTGARFVVVVVDFVVELVVVVFCVVFLKTK